MNTRNDPPPPPPRKVQTHHHQTTRPIQHLHNVEVLLNIKKLSNM